MKIQVSDIPEEGMEIEDVESIESETGGVASKARLKLRVEKLGTEVRLSGTVGAKLAVECSRCLKEFDEDLSIPVDLVFVPAEAVQDKEGHELASDEMNTGFYRDGELDLGEISGEQVLLNVSMKPLCNDSCKGICPHCGKDLNEGPCKCAPARSEGQMQDLMKYFEKRKE